jgi:hypothetical protein
MCDALSGFLTTMGFPPEMVQQVEQFINDTILTVAAVVQNIKT